MGLMASKGIIFALFLVSVLSSGFGVTGVSAHSGDSIVAVSGSNPVIDGSIEPDEWDDASTVTISVTGGYDCTVYVKQDGVSLYVGFSIPDATYNGSDSCFVIFDVDHDGNALLQTDDIWLLVSRVGANKEYNVTAGGWYLTTVSGWTAKASSTPSGWQSECNITYSKLDVTPATNKTLGAMFLSLDKDVEGYYTWSSDASITSPVTWGDMVVIQEFPPDTTPPTLSIISPENKTYLVNNVSLTFTVNESTFWIGYSLDSQANVTIPGNTTLSALSEGSHGLVVYAKDPAGNTGVSEIIHFSIETRQAEAFPTWIVAAIVIIAGVGAALLVYFAKVKKTTKRVE